MKKEKIEIEISDVRVVDRYYSFKYKIFRNDKLVEDDIYESDHSWDDDKKGFEKALKKGSALATVLVFYGENL